MTHESGTLPPEGVRTMFDRIAPVYDVMNRVMTVGLDRRWRRLTAEAVVRPGDRVLDAPFDREVGEPIRHSRLAMAVDTPGDDGLSLGQGG